MLRRDPQADNRRSIIELKGGILWVSSKYVSYYGKIYYRIESIDLYIWHILFSLISRRSIIELKVTISFAVETDDPKRRSIIELKEVQRLGF